MIWTTLALTAFLTAVPDGVPAVVPEIADDSVQVEHLRAFALLYGHVRWFHPSDEAADVSWDDFAILGAERIGDVRDSAELQAELERLFLPIAPTLRLHADGTPEPPPAPEASPADTAGLEVVAWQHLGMGTGIAGSVYQSARLNRERELTPAAQPGILTQSLDAESLRGREIRLTAAVRPLERGAQGQLWLRVDLEGGGQGFFDNMAERPVRSTDGAEVGIEGSVDPDASRLLMGSITLNGGVAYAGIRLEVREDDGSWRRVPRANADLTDPETTGGSIPGWFGPGQGWTVEALAQEDAPQPTLRVTPQRFTMSGRLFEATPDPGEQMELELGGGIRAFLPLSLYSRDGRTLGTPDPDQAAWLEAELRRVGEQRTQASPEAQEERLRIADVVVAWNVFHHFYPYFDVVDVDWDAILTEGLRRALLPQTHGEFQRDLEWLVAKLEDGHGRVTGPAPAPAGRLPASLERIEGRVVVVATNDRSDLQRGDVITHLDGMDAEPLLEQEAERFSGSVQWREFRALGELGRGLPGESARVDLLRDGLPETLQVPRIAGPPPENPRPDPIAELEPGIFYVDLDRVVMEAFESRVEELAEAEGVIFDLRGYPNGNHLILSHLSDEPLQSAFWRIPQIIRPDFQEPVEYLESRWNLAPRTPRIGGRIAFITDGRAISYAESVMGIVEHYGLGDIVGGPTAGANGNVNPFTLPGGSRVVWTGMRVENHDRTLLHGRGIQPTHPVERTIAGVREGRDELLEAALDRVR